MSKITGKHNAFSIHRLHSKEENVFLTLWLPSSQLVLPSAFPGPWCGALPVGFCPLHGKVKPGSNMYKVPPPVPELGFTCRKSVTHPCTFLCIC